MLHDTIPVPYSNTVHDHDCSNNCTIIVSNASHSEFANTHVSDNRTKSTQLSTDSETDGDDKEARAKVSIGIFIPHHLLPWGGTSTNKTAAKEKKRIKEQEKQRAVKEASNP